MKPLFTLEERKTISGASNCLEKNILEFKRASWHFSQNFKKCFNWLFFLWLIYIILLVITLYQL